ncbi:MAG: hypothetical protein ACRDOZ_15375 [Nocardioides sp.]
MRILEPGRKRRHHRHRLLILGLWGLAVGLAAGIIIAGAIIR